MSHGTMTMLRPLVTSGRGQRPPPLAAYTGFRSTGARTSLCSRSFPVHEHCGGQAYGKVIQPGQRHVRGQKQNSEPGYRRRPPWPTPQFHPIRQRQEQVFHSCPHFHGSRLSPCQTASDQRNAALEQREHGMTRLAVNLDTDGAKLAAGAGHWNERGKGCWLNYGNVLLNLMARVYVEDKHRNVIPLRFAYTHLIWTRLFGAKRAFSSRPAVRNHWRPLACKDLHSGWPKASSGAW